MTVIKVHSLKAFQPNWLILDAALCPEPLWFAKGAGVACHSLFDYRDLELVDNGPWLISCEGQEALIKLVLEKDVTGHSALWCNSELILSALKEALIQRLYAVKPDGETTRFRFYDPRVLHFYLNEETQDNRDRFLEPLGSIRYSPLNPFYFENHWFEWQKGAIGYSGKLLPIMEN